VATAASHAATTAAAKAPAAASTSTTTTTAILHGRRADRVDVALSLRIDDGENFATRQSKSRS